MAAANHTLTAPIGIRHVGKAVPPHRFVEVELGSWKWHSNSAVKLVKRTDLAFATSARKDRTIGFAAGGAEVALLFIFAGR